MDNCDIWVSAEKGDVLGILQCLQPWRPPPTARGAYKRTALHWACSAGHSLATAFLLPFFTSAPPRPELQICKDVHGNTPLHLAVNNSHVKCVQAILQSTQLAQVCDVLSKGVQGHAHTVGPLWRCLTPDSIKTLHLDSWRLRRGTLPSRLNCASVECGFWRTLAFC